MTRTSSPCSSARSTKTTWRSCSKACCPGVFDQAQRARLAYQADGNPEFAEEIALALIDHGVVAQSGDGTYRLLGDPELVEIPELGRRTGRSAHGSRRDRRAHHVAGRGRHRHCVSAERCSSAVATTGDSLQASLAELAAAELIEAPADRDDPHGYWTFRSHVVREVAYDSILRRRRPRMHRAVADALCRLEPDRAADNVELIASHFELSDEPGTRDPVPPQRGRGRRGLPQRHRRGRARSPRAVDPRAPPRRSEWPSTRPGSSSVSVWPVSCSATRTAAKTSRRRSSCTARMATSRRRPALEERVGWYLTISGDPSGGAHHLVRAQELAGADEIDDRPRSGSGLRSPFARVRRRRRRQADRRARRGRRRRGRGPRSRRPFTEARALMVNGVLCCGRANPNEARRRVAVCARPRVGRTVFAGAGGSLRSMARAGRRRGGQVRRTRSSWPHRCWPGPTSG